MNDTQGQILIYWYLDLTREYKEVKFEEMDSSDIQRLRM
jgi:hypothetical protein